MKVYVWKRGPRGYVSNKEPVPSRLRFTLTDRQGNAVSQAVEGLRAARGAAVLTGTVAHVKRLTGLKSLREGEVGAGELKARPAPAKASAKPRKKG